MFSPRSFALLATALTAIFSSQLAHVSAAPATQAASESADSGSSYWLANINRTGTVWGNSDASYKIFRDVTEYGADNTGVQDATQYIQDAIADGDRCGLGCNSSTITPAIVYFPAGTYLVSAPIKMYYYTQMIGDATNPPTIKMASSFTGMAMFDSDPYEDNGANWYINQNNFFRQVRNFVMDLTGGPDVASAIHWQVAQATSLQNILFNMVKDSGQQGIFMDNGSGGFMSDLKFVGGKIGAFFGSQQFTSRNLEFEDCTTAIYLNWDWGWTLSNITITGGTVGLDIANSPANMTTGSVMLSDSTISGTTYGVNTSYSIHDTNLPLTGNTMVIDNVNMTGTTAGVWSFKDQQSLVDNGLITAWAQGNSYVQSAQGTKSAGPIDSTVYKAPALLDSQGNVFGRSKPQYENVDVSNFVSAKASGCIGDGETDDTANVQNFLDSVSQSTSGAIAYFDHGAYLIKGTITVPNNIKIVGEIWSLIVADGSSFADSGNPQPVWQVGKPGDNGAVEMQDLIFETKGAAPGAIMIEWNLNSTQGDSGMWDCHVRIGGSANTGLSEDECPGDPTTEPTAGCEGVFLMFHATEQSGGVLIENNWWWVADHDLEVNNQTQISIYSGRGALVQSHGAVWLWGSACEHSIIYNYQFDGAKAVFAGFIQSETPYFQPMPLVPAPLSYNSEYDDPTFTVCPDGSDNNGVPCKDAWGLRIVNSEGILIYSTGFYSFFNNYAQVCTPLGNCQEYMIRIQNSQVEMYTVTTKAAVNMILDDRVGTPLIAAPNLDVFGDTIARYSTGSS